MFNEGVPTHIIQVHAVPHTIHATPQGFNREYVVLYLVHLTFPSPQRRRFHARNYYRQNSAGPKHGSAAGIESLEKAQLSMPAIRPTSPSAREKTSVPKVYVLGTAKLYLYWGACSRLHPVQQRLAAHETRHASVERLQGFSEPVRNI